MGDASHVPILVEGLEQNMPDVVDKLLLMSPAMAHFQQPYFPKQNMLSTPQWLPSPGIHSVPSGAHAAFSLDGVDFSGFQSHDHSGFNRMMPMHNDFNSPFIKPEPFGHFLNFSDVVARPVKVEQPRKSERDSIVPSDSDASFESLRRGSSMGKRWKKKERECLLNGVRTETLHLLAQRLALEGRFDVPRAEDLSMDQIDSCIDELDWNLVANYVPNHSAEECSNQWVATGAALMAPDSPGYSDSPTGNGGRGKWSKEEDRRLVEAIRQFGDSHWKLVANYVGTRSAAQCLHRWKHSLKPSISRSKWTTQEDERLMQAVKKHGRHWSLIAHVMGNRTGAQCRERYCNKLDPEIYRGQWTAEEDQRLRDSVAQVGAGRWAQIAKILNPPRTDYQIRKRWYIISRNDPQHAGGDLQTPASGAFAFP